MGNGMFTREITLVLLVGHVTLFPCMYHSWEHSPIRYIEIVNQILLSVLAYYSTRIETAGNLSTWIGLQLLAKQRSRMAEILKHLLPQDMVEMVLSIHFKTGNEALPITLCRESRAIVLHLDLKNYTGLAARLEPDRLAEHINEIFKSFDRLVYSSESKAHGLFKIDTIGDAYEAAAWLSEPTEDSTEEELTRLRQRDAEVCAKMVKVGWSMIEAVTKYAAEQESKIECRIGIAYGQVLAGMLGKLQPRFHLMGEAVWDAHKLESSAETNTLRVGCTVARRKIQKPERGGGKKREEGVEGAGGVRRASWPRRACPRSRRRKRKIGSCDRTSCGERVAAQSAWASGALQLQAVANVYIVMAPIVCRVQW